MKYERVKRSKYSQTIIFVLLSISYLLLFSLVYKHIISTLFEYAGMINKSNGKWIALSWIILFLYLPLWDKVYLAKDKFSHEILLLLYLISFLPFTDMVGFGVFSLKYIIFNLLFWFILLMIICINSPALEQKQVFAKIPHRFDNGSLVLNSIFIFIALVIIYVTGVYGGFRISKSLFDIYGIRTLANDTNMPILLRYLLGWAQLLLPLCVGIYVKQKKWLFSIIGIIIGVLSFGFDGSKTSFFLVIMAVLINILPKITTSNVNRLLMIFANVGLLMSLIEYHFHHSLYIASYAVRRVMCVPELLRSNYFDYFTNHSPDYYRSSFLRHFGFVSEYDSIPRMISAYYYPNLAVSNSNNGLISDAITNMGILGILIYPIILAFFFRLMDKWTRNLYISVYLSLGVAIAFYMSNTFLLTTLLSHGLLIEMFALRRLNRYRWKENEQ